MWPNPRESFLCGDKFFQAEARLKNYNTKLSYIKPQYITWSWNQNFSTLRSSYLMVSFHFKEDGQVFSVILPICKVMKKKKKEIFEKKLKASVFKHKTWHHYVCKKKKCLHKKYKDFQFLMIRAKGW